MCKSNTSVLFYSLVIVPTKHSIKVLSPAELLQHGLRLLLKQTTGNYKITGNYKSLNKTEYNINCIK